MTETAATPDALGALVSRHPVAIRTRWINAVWALTIGALASWLGLWALLQDGGSGGDPGGGQALGVALGLGICGLVLGTSQAVRALRGGAGEYFEVRAYGLVHGNARGLKGRWTWAQIATITVPARSGAAGVYAHRFGNDYRCVLGLSDGGRVRVDGLAAGASTLGNAVIDHCPDARMLDAEAWTRRAGGRLLLGAALCVGGVIAMVRYISDHPGGERVTVDASGHTVREFVRGVGDTTIMLLGLGIAACGLGAVVFLALFVHGRFRRP
ncbi:hypothetical protein ACIRRH_02620 [Kitasatospora sp. NPDC101235]|uniref:hypothetical protein n=1 Tax=Kitasatospora sp. NPDC101235 TaxID=3364101 RepID=UPI0037F1B893